MHGSDRTVRRCYHLPGAIDVPEGMAPEDRRRLTEIVVASIGAAVRDAAPADAVPPPHATRPAARERVAPERRTASTYGMPSYDTGEKIGIPVAGKHEPAPPASSDADPGDDPHYVDNADYIDKVIASVRCSPLAADRYVLVWPGGRKLIFNDDIDWTGTTKALRLVNVHQSLAAAVATAKENHDIAVAANYDRAVAFYREGGAILPTWYSPETTPEIYALIKGVRRKVRTVAGNVEGVMRGQRNAMVIGAIAGGVLRFVVRWIPYFRAQPEAPPPRTGVSEEPATPTRTSEPAEPLPVPKPKTSSGITPKAPAPPPRSLVNATITEIDDLIEREEFLFENITRDGRVAVYRNPDTGQLLNVTLRQGGPKWLNPAWGRNRIEAEMRERGFILDRKSDTGGGRLYKVPATGEQLRIMPRPFPSRRFSNDDVEKHLTDFYYRYRPNQNSPEGPHSAIVDKPVFGPDKPPS